MAMVQVPPLKGAVEERAIDRALSLSLKDDREGALRIAGALLEAEPQSAFNTFVVAWLLGGLGRKDELTLGLRAALERAVFDGNLPLAIAAYALLRDADVSVDGSRLVPADTWTCIELHVRFGTTDGAIELYFDGALAASATDRDTTVPRGLPAITAGLAWKDVESEHVVYVDEVVADTSRIGCD